MAQTIQHTTPPCAPPQQHYAQHYGALPPSEQAAATNCACAGSSRRLAVLLHATLQACQRRGGNARRSAAAEQRHCVRYSSGPDGCQVSVRVDSSHVVFRVSPFCGCPRKVQAVARLTPRRALPEQVLRCDRCLRMTTAGASLDVRVGVARCTEDRMRRACRAYNSGFASFAVH